MQETQERLPKEQARADVKSQVAQIVIDAMEQGTCPWQRPWSEPANFSPRNLASQRPYQGVNRLLLSMSGRPQSLWCTYNQAAERGWNVRKGEKGTMVVKLLDLSEKRGDRERDARESEPQGAEEAGRGKGGKILMRYWVFNRDQLESPPALELSQERDFDPITKAESVMAALQERTSLVVTHGAQRACYWPIHDRIDMPKKTQFKGDSYAYFGTLLHEAAHSTLHESRLNRRSALISRWSEEALAAEELTAELAAAILCDSTGVSLHAAKDPKHYEAHIHQHGAYLRSWIRIIKSDPLAIFGAARDAEKISEYLLALERQHVAMEPHQEWVRDFEETHVMTR